MIKKEVVWSRCRNRKLRKRETLLERIQLVTFLKDGEWVAQVDLFSRCDEPPGRVDFIASRKERVNFLNENRNWIIQKQRINFEKENRSIRKHFHILTTQSFWRAILAKESMFTLWSPLGQVRVIIFADVHSYLIVSI